MAASLEDEVEVHVFRLKNSPSLGPIALILPSTNGLESSRERTESAFGFSASSSVKRRLAGLLGLRLSTVKFCPKLELQQLAQKDRPLKTNDMLLLLDPDLQAQDFYSIRTPAPLSATLLEMNHQERSISGEHLMHLLGASWLLDGQPMKNLLLLCKQSDENEALPRQFLCRRASCSVCMRTYLVPGAAASKSVRRCSHCNGDVEHLATIRRLALALRIGGDPADFFSLRVMLRRAIRCGHAEAVQAICSLGGRASIRFSQAEIDLAVRSRRAGILGSVLFFAEDSEVIASLGGALQSAISCGYYGGEAEAKLVIADLRSHLHKCFRSLHEQQQSPDDPQSESPDDPQNEFWNELNIVLQSIDGLRIPVPPIEVA